MPGKKQNRKKNPKRNFRKQRARVVETKRRESAEIQIGNSTGGVGTTFAPYYPDTTKDTPVSSATSLSMMPIRSFYRMSKGTRKNQMLGNEIFSKSLYLKGNVKGLPSDNSIECYLVHGWLADTLSHTEFTSTPLRTTTRTHIEDFILKQVKQHFDQAKDEMRYREAKKDNLKIVGYRKLQHPKDAAYNDKINFKLSWRVNRKVVYSQGQRLTVGRTEAGLNFKFVDMDLADGGTADINMTNSVALPSPAGVVAGDNEQKIPNNSHLPFACLYMPTIPSPGSVTLAYNDIHYFTG